MPNINRTDDGSQKVKVETFHIGTAVAASAGIAYNVFQAPWPCTLLGAGIAAAGVSGAPDMSIDILRFNGVGGTSLIPGVGATLAVLAYGASAAKQMFTVPAASSTLVSLQMGDVVVLNQLFSGGNVAVRSAAVSIVVQPTQDILTQFGESYSGT